MAASMKISGRDYFNSQCRRMRMFGSSFISLAVGSRAYSSRKGPPPSSLLKKLESLSEKKASKKASPTQPASSPPVKATMVQSSPLLKKLDKHKKNYDSMKPAPSIRKVSKVQSSPLLEKLEERTTNYDSMKPTPSIGPILSGIKAQKSRKMGHGLKNLEKDDSEMSFPMKFFDGKGLGIFTTETLKSPQTSESEEMYLFDKLEQEKTENSLKSLPRNYFEEVMDWTKEGKMWKFPVNNEQGLEEEAQVSFHEHVFMDKYLSLFPSKGPIKHYMELVLVGLSKNAHLTVKEKEEHVKWYADYFKDKAKLM